MEALTSYLSDGERNSDSDDEMVEVFEVEDDECKLDAIPQYSPGATTYFAEDLAYVAQYAINPSVEFQAPAVSVSTAPAAATNNSTEGNDDSSDDDNDSDIAHNEVAGNESPESSDSEPDILATSTSKNDRKKAVRWLTEEEDEDIPDGPIRTKNEVVEIVETVPLPSRPPIATTDLKPIGEVLYRIDHEKTVVIQADHTLHPLNEGSLICSETGVIVGSVHEVFGPITRPFYIVRYNKSNASSNTAENVETAIPAIFTVGVKVFTATEHSTFITPQMLGHLRSKGSDASNVYDEEPAVEEVEYSDDEEELLAKQAKKRQSKKGADGTSSTDNNQKNSSGNKRKIVMHGSQGGSGTNTAQQGVIHVPLHMFQQQPALHPPSSSSQQQVYGVPQQQQQQQAFYQPPPLVTAAWPQQSTTMPYPAWPPQAGGYAQPPMMAMQQLPQYQYKPLGHYQQQQQQQPILQPPPPPGPHPSQKPNQGSG